MEKYKPTNEYDPNAKFHEFSEEAAKLKEKGLSHNDAYRLAYLFAIQNKVNLSKKEQEDYDRLLQKIQQPEKDQEK